MDSLFYGSLLDRNTKVSKDARPALAGWQTGLDRTAPQTNADSTAKRKSVMPQMSAPGSMTLLDVRDAVPAGLKHLRHDGNRRINQVTGHSTCEEHRQMLRGVLARLWLHPFRHAHKGLDNKLLMGPF